MQYPANLQSLANISRIMLSAALAIALAACGRGKGTGTTSTGTLAAEASAAAKSEDHPPPPPLPVPDSVTLKEAIPYAEGPGADPARNLLDLYLPKQTAAFPTVIFVHGGGYQRGDRTLGHNLGVVLANHGVAVASISYRLYPQVKHPSQMQDVAKAFAWVKSHIGDYGGDPSRVHVSGHSAGGHLAALLGTDGSYLAAENLKPTDIASVLAISGGYRINPIRKDVFGDDAAMAAASPFAHISGNHPPFVLFYGSLEKADRHELSGQFRDALLGARGQAVCVMIPERDHQGLLDRVAEGDPTVLAILHAVENPAR